KFKERDLGLKSNSIVINLFEQLKFLKEIFPINFSVLRTILHSRVSLFVLWIKG
ncbi:hypothetical protein GIB67_023768, partial [Kingdonia uniflora]